MTSIAEEQKSAQPAPSSHTVAEMLLRFRELGIVLALVLVVGATTIDNPLFLSATNVQQILSGAAIIALLAIGETIVIITRNVDLSIGSVLGISAYATGSSTCTIRMLRSFSCSSSPSASASCAESSTARSSTIARVPSLVVTLGTLYIIRGIDGAWAGGNQVNASMLPENFNKIGYGTFLGIPYLAIIAIVAVGIATYAMRSFRTARDFYAIGSDPDAARLAGIPIGSRSSSRSFSAAGSRASPARSGSRSTGRSTRSPAPATSFRSSPRSSSAASRSSAAAAPSSAPRSVRCS